MERVNIAEMIVESSLDDFFEQWQSVFVAILSFPWAYEMCQLCDTGTMYRVAAFPLVASIGLVLPIFINQWLPWVYFPAVLLATIYFSTLLLSELAILRYSHRLLFLSLMGALCITAAAIFFLQPLISHGFQWQFDLPYQYVTVVFLEYSAPCLWLIFYQRHWYAGLPGFSFPIFYLMTSQMRLHHSFSGLILWCFPSWPIRYLGTILMLDSALYFLRMPRGRYDIMNVIVDSFPLLINLYTISVILAHHRQSAAAQVIPEKHAVVNAQPVDSEMGHVLV